MLPNLFPLILLLLPLSFVYLLKFARCRTQQIGGLMLAILYLLSLSLIVQAMHLQAGAMQFTPQEMLMAIQLYEQEAASEARQNATENTTPSDLSRIANFTTIKTLCQWARAIDHISYVSKYFIGLAPLFFGEAALGGDWLTGNAFVEGHDDESIIALKINKTLLDEQHISLKELFEIFERLREDLTVRTRYLNHRADKATILHVLHDRKKRLLNHLHVMENHIFHFRKHPSLHDYQKRVALTGLVLGSVLGSLWLLASRDFETNNWQNTESELIQKNLQFLSKILLSKIT